MKPITYYHDSPATQSLAKFYGPRLQDMVATTKDELIAALGVANLKGITVREAAIETLGHTDIPCRVKIYQETDIPALLKAIANTL